MNNLKQRLDDMISTMDESRLWHKLGDQLPTMSDVEVLAVMREAEKSDNFAARLLATDCKWHLRYRLQGVSA